MIRTDVRRLSAESAELAVRSDAVSVEEPLEIRINGEPMAVVMRTPGSDLDLAAGFLLTEAIICEPVELEMLSYCDNAQPPNELNTVEASLGPSVEFDSEAQRRNTYASSSCGVCGKASIDQIRLHAPVLQHPSFAISRAVLFRLPQLLQEAQEQFRYTGSLHAAALFDRDGKLLELREDVGRHNAVDKLVGHFVLSGQRPPADTVLLVSGRSSFEIVQKAWLAGISFVAAVSGPTSLAVDLARETGMTLVGFLRGRTGNVYSGEQRIVD
ncbi:MAG: formate dehydrogenase accessory sulfurtransferase FdhD [Candidatus Latescibacterota bacterium]|nr:formate dehydrogenase accessory sulfurtransferase FdhD [Candidatus Latescibacterota bacterium]